MAEFEEAVANEEADDAENMINSLNENQRRVFDKVSSHLQAQLSSDPLRMFDSGCSGTGKKLSN